MPVLRGDCLSFAGYRPHLRGRQTRFSGPRRFRAQPELPGFIAGCRHDAALLGSADGDRLAAEIWIVPLLDGCIEGVHVDMDDLALAARGRLVVIVLDGHVASLARPYLP